MKKLSKRTRQYLKKSIKNQQKRIQQIKNNEQKNNLWKSVFDLKTRPNLKLTDYLQLIFIHAHPECYVIKNDNTLSFNDNILSINDQSWKEKYFVNKKYVYRLNELIEKGYVTSEVLPIDIFLNKTLKNKFTEFAGSADDTLFQNIENDMKTTPSEKNFRFYYLTNDGLNYFKFSNFIERNSNIVTIVLSFIGLLIAILPILLTTKK